MTFINLTTREIAEADEAPEGFVLWTQDIQDQIDAEIQAETEAAAQAKAERLAKLAAEAQAQQAIRDAEAQANVNAVVWLAAEKWIRNGVIVASLPAVPTPVATNIGMVFGTPSPAVRVWWYQSQGYSVATAEDIAAAEAKAIADAQAAEAARIAAEEARQIAVAQAEIDRQLNKHPELIVAENKFMLLCQQLTGAPAPVKLGFDQLDAIIKAIPDQMQAAAVAIELLAIDAQGKRYADNRWWDDITWHTI